MSTKAQSPVVAECQPEHNIWGNLTKGDKPLWLWGALKSQHKSGPVFRRQHAIGPYILDFYCVKARLTIEVDGEMHSRDLQRQKDELRDAYLAAQGIETLRVLARDLLMSPDETITGIIDFTLARMANLKAPLPSASQPPSP